MMFYRELRYSGNLRIVITKGDLEVRGIGVISKKMEAVY